MRNNRVNESGFSLAEVVISLAIVAVAIPSIIGMFGKFSNVSVEIRDRDDLRAIINQTALFLEKEAGLVTGSNHFATVYEWVKKASQNPDQAEVLYVYLPASQDSAGGNFDLLEMASNYTISQTPPTEDDISLLDGRIIAVELHAPQENILPKSTFSANFSNYPQTWLPLELHIYALATADEQRGKFQFLDSVPIVISL